MENINETNLPLPFFKPFGLTSGASVRDRSTDEPNFDEKRFQLFQLFID